MGSRGLSPAVFGCRALEVCGHGGEDTPETSWLRFCACCACTVRGIERAWRDPTGCACVTPRLLFRGGDEVWARPCRGVGRCVCPRRGRTPGWGCAVRRLGRRASACRPISVHASPRVQGEMHQGVRACVPASVPSPPLQRGARGCWGLGGRHNTRAGLWCPSSCPCCPWTIQAGLGACAGLLCQGREQDLTRGRCGARGGGGVCGKNGIFCNGNFHNGNFCKNS